MSESHKRRFADLGKAETSSLCETCGGAKGRGGVRYCSPECYRVARLKVPPADRFWPKVRKGPDCWLWSGSAWSSGYGSFTLARPDGSRRALGAHVFAYESEIGPIAHGQFVLHHCDTPLCVRPDHLFLGTHVINMRDAQVKGRLHVPRPRAQKVTRADLAAIDAALSAGDAQKAIAQRFGLSEGYISRYKAGSLRQYDRPTAAAAQKAS